MRRTNKRMLKYGLIICISVSIGFVMCQLNYTKIYTYIDRNKGICELLQMLISAFSTLSIYFLYRQIKAEHEKSRREKTVDLLVQWSLQLKPETNMAVKIVEKFDKKQCGDLVSMSEFYVEKEIYKDIRSLLNNAKGKKGKKTKNRNSKVKLSKKEVIELRFLVILYLNMLESILAAWQMSIVDREVIERQFSYLYKPEEDKKCLENFRIAIGGEECYPAISGFIMKLQEERKAIIKEKGYIE